MPRRIRQLDAKDHALALKHNWHDMARNRTIIHGNGAMGDMGLTFNGTTSSRTSGLKGTASDIINIGSTNSYGSTIDT